MLISIALIMLIGIFAGWLCSKIKLPALVGMILTGIVLGPCVLNLIDESVLGISGELRKIALIIILTRAGLTLSLKELKKVGRPAFLMCFLPATFEIIGMVLLAPVILDVTYLEAAIIGAVVAAVSPAVVVPKMIRLTEEGYGNDKGIPQLILAGASVDDVYVIVLFTAFTSLATGGKVDILSFVNIPFSIAMGVAFGLGIGMLLGKRIFEKFNIRPTVKVISLLSIGFLLVTLEDNISTPLTFSALIAIMFIGNGLQDFSPKSVEQIKMPLTKIWIFGEVLLFVLVGAAVNIDYAAKAGFSALLLIPAVLVFRMIGVLLALIGTDLNKKERLFCMLAYMPKATVQAAIGGMPLAMGLACGETVLAVAVIAILITAPLGAFAIDSTYKKWLNKT